MDKINLSEEQKLFPEWFKSQSGRICRLTGHAGSGKTTVMAELAKVLPRKKTLWACPSHQAKNILSGKLPGRQVHTVAAVLGLRPVIEKGKIEFLPVGQDKLKGKKYLVIDESSMNNTDTVRIIIESKIDKVLFVGDPAQLPPVGEKISPIYSSEFDDLPTYHLGRVFRQSEDSPILHLSVSARERGVNNSKRLGIPTINVNYDTEIEGFFKDKEKGVVLAPTHKLKERCNMIARKLNGFPDEKLFCKDEIIFLESPIEGGPVNGDRVRITSKPKEASFMGFPVWACEIDEAFDVKIPYDIETRKSIEKYIEILGREYDFEPNKKKKKGINKKVSNLFSGIIFASPGYAMTIHKSQGSTFDDVLLILKDIYPFKRQGIHLNMIYTGITRAAKTLILGE